ncbi:hypothetical protein [Comamonas endophytica]|uniref:Uncharacterized protein n=1 Tax=Comamonas endophytica TaxID=2949090 RepID=A0ABY6GAY8_9BURK|nr:MULTISPECIES: hypothetical protein [unclassified Acidovorax]MCD2513773.1 hypothetical protein [Acidovorax sp. D4N7]UYG52224.1 hypothetical protein M9799_03005 [Acidovorax sp. 5MLIR]
MKALFSRTFAKLFKQLIMFQIRHIPRPRWPSGPQPTAHHLVYALALCSLAAWGTALLSTRAEEKLQQSRAKMDLAIQQGSKPEPPASDAATHQTDQWPSRHSTNEVIRQASEEASHRGIVLRSLSVTHHAATASSRGKVMLDVSTRGSYAASKVWQSALMQGNPSLAVQNLRLQAVPGSHGVLDAQWTWVLYVHD